MPIQRIKALEKQHGNLHEVIPPLVKKHGQLRAGEILGVSVTTINRWLKQHGYVYKRVNQYQQVDEEKQNGQT